MIRTKPVTKEYEEGYERIFGENGIVPNQSVEVETDKKNPSASPLSAFRYEWLHKTES